MAFCFTLFYKINNDDSGNSLVVQWLGLHTLTAMGRVESLVGELRSHKPRGLAKKKKIILPEGNNVGGREGNIEPNLYLEIREDLTY